MLAVERKRLILEAIYRDGQVIVAELSDVLKVTEETIRRDLHKMEKEGLISRTHGGAVAREAEIEDLPYRTRQITNIAAKRQIAMHAAKLVQDGDAIMMDSSSTVFEVLHTLKGHDDLTLITNSARMIADPGATPYAIMSVGGELRRRSMTFVGPLAKQAIKQFRADLALISCKALSLEGGIMDASVPDAEVKRAFIQNAKRVCLLADSSKFGQTALFGMCSLDQINVIITDVRPSDDWVDTLTAHGVELIC